MISRQWRGLARVEHAEDYVRHLREETFVKLSSIPGFVKASILRREERGCVEFLIVTYWQSMEAIMQFAGSNPEMAVVPDKVKAMMLEFDRVVHHYEVINEVTSNQEKNSI